MNNPTKLLIVEDDPDLAAGYAIRLGADFDTMNVVDGVSAVQAARKHRPDVILLDLGLPAGDGFRVLTWLREDSELSQIPVVVATGRDAREARNKALTLGAAAFFNKPVDIDDLVATLTDLANQPRRKRRRLLVVEDDADVRTGLVARLRSRDYDVMSAQDGVSALMAVKRHDPELVVLDLGLPAGDGFAVLERMRRLDKHSGTPIVVLSGRDAAANRAKALEAGASLYIEKPATGSEVLAAIEELL